MTMTMGRRPGLLLLVALLPVATACGLPVPTEVQSDGPVAADSVERGDIQVLPPGPRPDAGPREMVLGFLGAQTSAEDDHALAREFLAPEVREEWQDSGSVVVYDPASLEVVPDPADELLVRVRADTVASIGGDGAYLLNDGTTEDTYRLTRDAQGQLRLAEVPPGLRLTPAGAGRTFEPHAVYFSAPAVAGEGRPTPTRRLVPDRVFLPVDDVPDALVRRLLAGPSVPLRGAVENAFPAGTELAAPVSVREGVVTVELTGSVADADAQARRQLSAQLVWTLLDALPAATSVRLRVDGERFEVPGTEGDQERGDWLAFDPAGASVTGAAVFVEDRTLQRLDGTLADSEATDGRLAVDLAAVSPSTGTLALVTRGAAGEGDAVRTGPPSGPFEPVLTAPAVRSVSWGSGERGLWVVADAADPAAERRVLLVPEEGDPVEVGYARPGGAGPLAALRVSRDGARVAAVFGEGRGRRLHVGRVESGDEGLRLASLRPVAPGLTDVADVAWESGTSLVVLAPLGTPNRLPVRVSVDGSEVEPVRTLGLDGEPETVAAAPGRPLVIGATLAGRPVLLVEDGGLFRLQAGTGAVPAYAG